MNQSEFQRALQKFEKQKKKRAEAAVAALEGKPKPIVVKAEVKADPALPFIPLREEKPKEAKLPYVAPKLAEMVISFEGPVPMKFTVEYSGTLMGGQMNEQSLRPIVIRALSVLGRVR